MEDLDIDSNLSNKISQTVFPIYNFNSADMSLVNSRIYSPIPEFTVKSHSITPKKIKKYYPVPKKHVINSECFRLPVFAAETKELISPFSIKTKDFLKLYDHNIVINTQYFNLPSIKPRNSLIKPPRRLKAIKNAEMIGSKKELSVRKKKIP